MSDESKIAEILAGVEKAAAQETKKEAVIQKELRLRERKADALLEKFDKNDRDMEIAKTIDYNYLSDEEIQKKQQDNSDYLTAARNKLPFINEVFDEAIPFFRKNLILIGAPTGSGKSTTVANLVRGLLGIKSKSTGKFLRTLVLTNEEKSEDVYNRVTCLCNGWSYTNHDKFTAEQMDIFNTQMSKFRKFLTVIDDQYGGIEGNTTSLEGICQIFDNLIAKQEYYDVVIIDYYQNVTDSKKNPTMNEYEVQSNLSSQLDKYKNIYPAPIVVFAQVRETDTQNTPFKIRIEGRKKILNVATCAVEMVAHHQDRATEWRVHKSRFNQAVGKKLWTGYQAGMYVVRTKEFMAEVEAWRSKQEGAEFDKTIGFIAPKAEEGEEK